MRNECRSKVGRFLHLDAERNPAAQLEQLGAHPTEGMVGTPSEHELKIASSIPDVIYQVVLPEDPTDDAQVGVFSRIESHIFRRGE